MHSERREDLSIFNDTIGMLPHRHSKLVHSLFCNMFVGVCHAVQVYFSLDSYSLPMLGPRAQRLHYYRRFIIQ